MEMSFGNMDLALAGMWIAEDDGVLNPRTIKVGPRKVVVANSVDSMKALDPWRGLPARRDRDRTPRALGAQDHDGRPPRAALAGRQRRRPGQPISATEAQINVDLVRQLLGPIYGRWMSEFVKRLATRAFGSPTALARSATRRSRCTTASST
jgi:hypothetical protein